MRFLRVTIGALCCQVSEGNAGLLMQIFQAQLPFDFQITVSSLRKVIIDFFSLKLFSSNMLIAS